MTKEQAEVINKIDSKLETRKQAKKYIEFVYFCYKSFSFDLLQKIYIDPIEVVNKFIQNTIKEIPQCPKDLSTDLLFHMLRPKAGWMDGLYTRFDNIYMNTHEDFDSIIMQYLEDKENLLKLLLINYSLIEVKVIEDHIKELVKDITLEISKYESKYECDCGTFYRSHSGDFKVDTRELFVCCSHCGRSTKTWKLVSGRSYTLIKKIHKKVWGFINVTTEKRVDCGFSPTSFKQYDEEEQQYWSYFHDKVVQNI